MGETDSELGRIELCEQYVPTLPWIRVPHLASKILGTNLRRLDADWRQTWSHGLVLAETFVDVARFQGTCYRAANWIEVGITQGRGKKGNRYHHRGRPKTVWIYPLHRHWRQRLTAPEPPPHPPRLNETRSIGEVSKPTPGR